MAPRRKLLFVSPCTPDPHGTGWEQRAFGFLSAYSKFMDIELWFTPTHDNPELLRIGKLTGLCVSITSFHPELINAEKSTLKARLIQSLSSSDVVHIFRLPQMVSAINGKPMVWDVDELPWSARRVTADQQRALSELYSRCFSKCRRVFACSASEKLETQFDEIVVIPNVVIDPEIGDFDVSEKPPVLAFVGNLNYAANTEALAFFTKSILPDLSGSVPDIVVDVVGRSPVMRSARAAVEELRNTSRLQFFLDVPSCTPYYRRAVASIVPVLSGGGTRTKIVESFAHRCPVISTTKGCEGLDVAHGKHLLIADSPGDFASACAELIRDPQLRMRLTECGFGFFKRNHSQEVVDRLLFSATENL